MHEGRVFRGSLGCAWSSLILGVVMTILCIILFMPDIPSILVFSLLFGVSFVYVGFQILGIRVEATEQGLSKRLHSQEEFSFTWDQIGAWWVQPTPQRDFLSVVEARFVVPGHRKELVVSDCDTGYSHFETFVAVVRRYACDRETKSRRAPEAGQ